MRHYDSPGYIGDQLASHFEFLKSQGGVDLNPKHVVLGSNRYPYFSGAWHLRGGMAPTPTVADDLHIFNKIMLHPDKDEDSYMGSDGYVPLESGHLLQVRTSSGGINGWDWGWGAQIGPGWGDVQAMDKKGIDEDALTYETDRTPVNSEHVEKLINTLQQVPVTKQSMDLNRKALERASIFHRATGLNSAEIPFNVYKTHNPSETGTPGAYDPNAQSFRFIR